MLVVDDEVAFLVALRKLLNSSEISVDTAENLNDALSLMESKSYDYVISDLRLTGVLLEEGFEVLRYAKESHIDTKVIILTGYGTPEVKKKAYDLGADFYFEKPVAFSILMGAINVRV